MAVSRRVRIGSIPIPNHRREFQDRSLMFLLLATTLYLSLNVPACASSSTGTPSSSSWSPTLAIRQEGVDNHYEKSSLDTLGTLQRRHEYDADEGGFYKKDRHHPLHGDQRNTNKEYTSVAVPPMHVCRYHLSTMMSRIQRFARKGGQSLWPARVRRSTHNDDDDNDRRQTSQSSNTVGDIQHAVSVLLSTVKYVGLGLLVFEACLALKDIVREAWNEVSDSGSGHPPVLSSEDVKKLVLWLDQPRHIRQSKPPPRISAAPFMVSVAQDLHDSCPALTMEEKQRILSQLSRPDASLLQSCLLRHPSNNGAVTNKDSTADHSSSSMDRVGGLFKVKETIRRWVQSSTALSPQTTSSSIPVPETVPANSSPYKKLVSDDRGGLQGMVLWGPPGCGKSMLLRSISQQSGLPTLVVTPSLIQRKWYGESNQRVRSLFGLIRMLGSCVVVLDEVDGLFQTRRDDDHEAGRDLKTEWFQWWDGVVASSSSSSSSESSASVLPQHKVLILGATNRPWDVDPAAWRRLPHRLYVGLPNTKDRIDLLLKWTSDLPRLDTPVIASLVMGTDGYTPTDLLQVLKLACQLGPIARDDAHLTIEDVNRALAEFTPVRFSARYVQELQKFMGSHSTTSGWSTSITDSSHRVSTELPPGMSLSCIFGNYHGYKWSTPLGHYYQFHMQVDSDVVDSIKKLYWNFLESSGLDGLDGIDEDDFDDSDTDYSDIEFDFDDDEI